MRPLALALVLAGCAPRMPAAPSVSLVDPARPASVEGVPDRWALRDTLRADLDGDGVPEQVVVLADVGLDAAGEPVWDAGQDWEVTVVAADGARTRIYARYLQLGRLRTVVTHDGHMLRLVETGAAETAVYDVRYDGPGRVRAVERARGTPANE